jgi:structural maintenance of chromosomes protein 6
MNRSKSNKRTLTTSATNGTDPNTEESLFEDHERDGVDEETLGMERKRRSIGNDEIETNENIENSTPDINKARGNPRLSASNRGSISATTNSNTSGAAEAGIIKSIYCENFMCHLKLRVKLSRNVTFIHGQNGSGKYYEYFFLVIYLVSYRFCSFLNIIYNGWKLTSTSHMCSCIFLVGKSAVLAAIQICLGANARRTHRARSLKDLVRRDTTTNNIPTCAKVQVTLYNCGSDAYQHHVYGDTITIERTISIRAGGDNGYKLLDNNGVVQSKSKKDLDDMLDTLYVTLSIILR